MQYNPKSIRHLLKQVTLTDLTPDEQIELYVFMLTPPKQGLFQSSADYDKQLDERIEKAKSMCKVYLERGSKYVYHD